MAGRLTRFLNLERPRRPGDAPHHEVANTKRFTGEPSGMALEKDHGEQPFLRCPRCEADNSRYEQRCTNCQAPLDGDDVRAWNEQLWERRRAQAAEELAAQRARSAPLPRTQEELLQQNRMLGEALAREIGERERSRMSSWWSVDQDDSTPIGVRLLGLLPSTRARVTAGLIIGGLFLGCALVAYSGPRHSPLRIVGFVVDVVLVLLFSPNVPRYRRRWWW